MDIRVSDWDGWAVISRFPAPGWFGVVIGLMSFPDGEFYVIDVWGPGQDEAMARPLFLIAEADIEGYIQGDAPLV